MILLLIMTLAEIEIGNVMDLTKSLDGASSGDGGVVLIGDSNSPGADNKDSSSMDTSGASPKRKSDGDGGGGSGDCVFAKSFRSSRPCSNS